jgi:hypothetical protein
MVMSRIFTRARQISLNACRGQSTLSSSTEYCRWSLRTHRSSTQARDGQVSRLARGVVHPKSSARLTDALWSESKMPYRGVILLTSRYTGWKAFPPTTSQNGRSEKPPRLERRWSKGRPRGPRLIRLRSLMKKRSVNWQPIGRS